MKKTNRLIIFALSLAIVISALVGISVSAAEDEGALDIKSINLIYGDKVELLVAVDISNEYRDNVEVIYTFDGEKYTAELHPTEVYRDKDTNATFPVFRTIGIAPKDIGKPMTFEAHTKDSGATGTAYSASILDYLYARLYKEGYINKTEAEDIAKKNLYLNTIDYASSALEVLVNYKQGKNETLYSNYVFAWGADSTAKIASDRYFGAFVPGTEVTPIYVGEGEITEWNLYAANGEAAGTLATDTAYELNAHTKFEAVLAEIEEPDPEEPPVVEDTITVMDYEGGLPSNDYVKTYDADGNLVANTSWPASNPADSYASLDKDPKDAANHVLHVRVPANKTNIVTKVQLSNTLQTGNCYTFETKMYAYALSNGTEYANIQFINSAGAASLNISVKALSVANVANNAIAVYSSGTNYGGTKDTVFFDANKEAITANKWFTLRIEYYYAGGASVSGSDAIAAAQQGSFLKLYVNDSLVYEGNEYWQVTKDIKYAQITTEATGVAKNVAFDDIYFTRTDKEYAAD